MSDTATSTEDTLTPVIPAGESPEEAMAGLFEALGSEGEEFYEEPDESEQSSEEVEGDDLVSEEDADFEEPEEGDEENAESEDESEEDGDEADGDETDLIEVTLPGGETIEVTREEAAAGYSRTQDYTQKRQRDAAEHASAMQEVGEVREQYKAHLNALKSMLTEGAPAEPSEELRRQNPGEWSAQMAEYQAYQDRINAIGQAEEAIDGEISQEQLQTQQDYVKEQWGIVLNEVPDWQDPVQRQAGLTELKQYAMERGFSETEVDSLADARLLLMLRENMLLKRKRNSAEEKVAEKKGEAKQRLGPGGRNRSSSTKRTKSKKRQQNADQRLQETGSLKDAAASIELLLGDEDI